MNFLTNRSFLIALFIIVGINTVLLSDQSIRLDESQSISIAVRPIGSVLMFTAEQVHVPFYHLMLHFWLQFFGTDIIVARSLSFIFFLLTLFSIYKLGLEIGSTALAKLTTLLFSLSPFILWFSLEARMYSLFALMTSVNHLYYIKYIKSDGKKYQIAFFLSTVLGLYTHYFFLFLTLTQMLFTLSYIIARSNKGVLSFPLLIPQIKRQIKFLANYFGIIIVSLLFFLIWGIYTYKLGSAVNTQPIIPAPTSFNIIQVLTLFIFGFQNQLAQTLFVSLWPLSIMLLFLVFTKRRKTGIIFLEYFILVSFLPIILAFTLSYVIKPIFLARYLIVTVPSIFLLISAMLLNYPRRISSFLVTALIIFMFTLMLYQNTSAQTPVREDYKAATQVLNDLATPKDIIVVSAPFTVYPVEYSYRGKAKIDTIPPWNRFNETEGVIPGFNVSNLETQIQNYRKDYRKMFLLLSYDQGYERDIRNYLDNNLEMEKSIKFSLNMELRVYKLKYD